MSDVNWDLAPEGATGLIQNGKSLWWLKNDLIWSKDRLEWVKDNFPVGNILIATRPQERKTTQDVLEAYPEWPDGRYDAIAYNECIGAFSYYTTDYTLADGWELICTRKEYEKARADKVEEWTHLDPEGRKRTIIHVHDNVAWVRYENRLSNELWDADSLKPIKPQITKAKAWDMLNETECTIHEFGFRLLELQGKYEVVDESSEAKS